MAIKTSGSISLQDIQDEFGGSHPISFSEYYKNANTGYVTPNNTGVPNQGSAIRLNDFYGKEKAALIRYYLVGGGGGGGYGKEDRGGSGSASQGGHSYLYFKGNTYKATGGAGGGNGNINRANAARAGKNANIANGYFKNFGSSGGLTGNNRNASAGTGYAAGGSGGGGDAPRSTLFFGDRSGNAGTGGNAGVQVTGEFYAINGDTITYTLGSGGSKGSGGDYAGANGRPGAVVLLKDGTEVVYTGTNGSYTVSL